MNKNKTSKIVLMLSVVCVLLLVIGSASAADDDMDVNQTDSVSDEILTSDNADVVSTDTNNDVISDDNSEGSFTELNQLISNSSGYNNVVVLEKDYTYVDSDADEYINIPAYVTIDGNGHTINSKNSKHIFEISSSNIVLKNIKFTNSYVSDLDEFYNLIYISGEYFSIIDCNFTNMQSDLNGSIIFSNSEANGVYLNNVLFDNCSFNTDIYLQSNDNSINGITSINDNSINVVANFGSLTVDNSIFTESNSGAIYTEGSIKIVNSNFTKIQANLGVIRAIAYAYIENCIVDSNTVSNYAAVHLRRQFEVLNSTFTNNIGSQGGALYVLGDSTVGSVKNVTFDKNTAFNGGAIYAYYSNRIKVTESTFINNVARVNNPISNVNIDDTNKEENNTLIPDEYILLFNETQGTIYLDKDYEAIYRITLSNVNVTIDGQGKTIDGMNFTQLFSITNSDVTFKNLTIKNAIANPNVNVLTSYYGAIFTASSSTITFDNCTLANCRAQSDGGVMNAGPSTTLNIFNCIIKDNYAGRYGGAIKLSNGRLNINNTLFYNNTAETGGAIYLNSYQVKSTIIDNTRFIANTALTEGVISDLFPLTSRNIKFTNCTFEDNIALKQNPVANFEISSADLSKNNISEWASFTSTLNDNVIVSLDKDLTVTFEYTITANNLTIDGQGHTIDANQFRVFELTGSNVTIKNVIIKNAFKDGNGGAIYVNGVNCTIMNSTFNENTATNGGAIYVNGVNCTIMNSTFNDNTAESGAGIYYNNVGILSNIKFNNNIAITDNSVYFNSKVDYTDIIVDGEKFSNDFAFLFVNLSDNSTVAIDKDYLIGGTVNIVANNVLIDGQGFTIDANNLQVFRIAGSNVTIKNVIIKNAFKDGNGGAIYVNGVNCTIMNSTFNNNSAQNGGAIYVDYDGENFKISNVKLINNSAVRGGAVYICSNNYTIEHSDIINNLATYGGAFYLKFEGLVDNTTFTNNSAETGGAVLSKDSVAIMNCSFNDNSAIKGAGILSEGDETNITNSEFSNNVAEYGAGIVLEGDNTTVANVTLTDNVASYDGAGIVLEGDNAQIINSTLDSNEATSEDSGSIIVVNGDNATLNGNNILNNNGNAIAINGDNATVTDNIIANNTESGLVINGDDANVTDNTFENNTEGDIAIAEDSNMNTDETKEKLSEDNNNANVKTEIDLQIIEVTPTPIHIDENITVTINLNNKTGKVKVTVGNYTTEVTAVEGVATAVLPMLPVGEYTIIASVEETSGYYSGNVNTTVKVQNWNFTELQQLINDAVAAGNDTVILEHNYTCEEDESPITINDPITVEGDGHVIDANGAENAITINSDNVTVENLDIKNVNGTAVDVEADNVTLSKVDLDNVTGTGILVNGNDANLTGVNTDDCTGTAVVINGNNSDISSTGFGNHNGTGILINGTGNNVDQIIVNGGNGTGIEVTEDNNTINDVSAYDFTGTVVNVTGDNNTVNAVGGDNVTGTIVSVNGNNNKVTNTVATGGNATVVDIVGGDNNTVSNITSSGNAGKDLVDNGNNTKKSGMSPGSADSVFDMSKANADPAVFNINLPSDATGTFTVTVDGKNYTAEVKNGAATVSIPGLSSGNHDVTVSYSGDSQYKGLNKTSTITVPTPTPTKQSTVLTFAKKKYTFKKSKRSKTKTFKVTLKTKAGAKLASKKVFLKLTKVNKIKLSAKAKKAIKKAKAKVKKAKKAYKKSKTAKAKKALAKAKKALTKAKKPQTMLKQLKKGTYAVKTNKNGLVKLTLSKKSFNMKKFKGKAIKLTATFKGDSSYLKSAKTVKIVLK